MKKIVLLYKNEGNIRSAEFETDSEVNEHMEKHFHSMDANSIFQWDVILQHWFYAEELTSKEGKRDYSWEHAIGAQNKVIREVPAEYKLALLMLEN